MCTSLIAGKKATAYGGILLARDEDFDVNVWPKYMKYRKSPQYAGITEGMWTLGNGLCVPVPPNSFRYCSMPDAQGQYEAVYFVGDHFYLEERGVNERGVAVSATNSVGINDKALAADPLPVVGISESVIPTLLLPQVESAGHAIRILGGYIKDYGASEGNGILIGDEHEAWYFEIGSAHHWIAVKVPDDSYIAVSNCMRVHSVDLDDTDNVKCSAGLYDFVVKHNLLEKPDSHDFDFAGAFGNYWTLRDGKRDKWYNVDRLWLAQSILTPSKKQTARMTQYPLFLKPDKKIEIKDVCNLLRADYKGTELDGIATRPIGMVRTAESHIITIDPQMPRELKCVIWQTLSSPLGSAYMPLFAVTDDIPGAYAEGGMEYSDDSAYWRFKSSFSLSGVNGGEFIPALNSQREKYENRFIDEHERIKNTLRVMAEEDYGKAVSFAGEYSGGILRKMSEISGRRVSKLITTIAERQTD